jgi:hypothetical protein
VGGANSLWSIAECHRGSVTDNHFSITTILLPQEYQNILGFQKEANRDEKEDGRIEHQG